MSRFEATRGLFWYGPRNFELRSDDEDNACVGTPSTNFRTTTGEGHLALTNLTCTRSAYTAVLWWNRVSNLEPSGHEAETLPPGQSN
ncbi:hypothetical protein AVEN_267830-1 [Araneus ventricosus]|uniref:Uncharacterized protein n=1 Tax=Araneus ventricosus TaxID=182803 RepID=A0A4Y2D5M7_ARAVE|nr:hypothetical protein AVEN_267830-1 [Araneus ventricosus]